MSVGRYLLFIMPPPVEKGAVSFDCVRPSVCPSVRRVTYIANNTRTRRSSVSKFGRKVFLMKLAYQFQGQKVKVTRPINDDKHRPPYLPNAKAYELQTWYTDRRRRPASARGARPPRSNVKVARSRDQSEASWPNVISGRRGHTVSAEPGGHTSCH